MGRERRHQRNVRHRQFRRPTGIGDDQGDHHRQDIARVTGNQPENPGDIGEADHIGRGEANGDRTRGADPPIGRNQRPAQPDQGNAAERQNEKFHAMEVGATSAKKDAIRMWSKGLRWR